MDIARVHAILIDSFGEVDEHQQPVEGSEVFDFFVTALATKTAKVHEHAAEMVELLKEWPSESWGSPCRRSAKRSTAAHQPRLASHEQQAPVSHHQAPSDTVSNPHYSKKEEA